MKIHILFQFRSGPQAGGHNFLRSLANQLRATGRYAESPDDGDVILINSHHHFKEAVELRKKYPRKVFLLRVDGPMRIYNHSQDFRDDLVNLVSRYLADGIVYQSEWCRAENHRLYGATRRPECVIMNAPDPELFSPRERDSARSRPARVVITGWSTNPNKGEHFLQWLDSNLDPAEFEVNIVGNVGTSFRNIRCHAPVPPERLADELRKYDLFFFPSRFEACSNALLEALHSGLPAVVFGGSSNVEIVRDSRYHFTHESEILPAFRFALSQSQESKDRLRDLPTLKNVADRYVQFAQEVRPGYRRIDLIKLRLIRIIQLVRTALRTRLKI